MAIDTSRAPIGEMAARALVDALVASDDREERHYLEAKSHIDLASKVGRAKAAKFILGAANRVPDEAAKYFDGYAVLALGVGPGAAPGIPPVEVKDLQAGVEPYLTVNGPRWDIQRVRVDDAREVLLLLVDPPLWGQETFLCHKTFQPHGKSDRSAALDDGGTYVRKDGASRRATAAEILVLRDRASRATPAVALSVELSGRALRYRCGGSVLEEYIDAVTTGLREAASPPPPPDTWRSVASLSPLSPLSSLSRTEPRTKAQYDEQIDDWAERCRTAWPECLDDAMAAAWPGIAVVICNHERTFLEDLEVTIHLPGPVSALETTDTSAVVPPHDRLPGPPRRWGPIMPDLMGGRTWMPPPNFSLGGVAPPDIEFDNSGSVTLTVTVPALRPECSHTTADDEVVLLVRDLALDVIEGTWRVTARGHHDVFEGTVRVEVSDVLDITEKVRSMVRDDEES